MCEPFSQIPWLQSHTISDEKMAEAYEHLGLHGRTVLKKNIALLHRIWGESPGRCCSTRHWKRQGFGLEYDENPVSYVVVVCEASYTHPAAFLAAFMPALLAGVDTLLVCFAPEFDHGILKPRKPESKSPQDDAIASPLLAALELAGVERALAATQEELLALLNILQTSHGNNGRLVLLGEPFSSQKLAAHAHATGLTYRSFTHPPLYFSKRLAISVEQSFGKDNLPLAAEASRRAEHVNKIVPLPEVPLHLDAENEDVWVWPDLDPAWFRSRQMRLFSTRSARRTE